MRYRLALAFVLLTAGFAQAQPAADKRIVPGERIGPYALSMTIDDLTRAIGPKQPIGEPAGETEFLPKHQDLVKPLWVHRWDQVRLRVLTVERSDQAVVGMTVLGGDYKTDKAVGVGSTRQEVIAAYGEPTAETAPNDRQSHLIYDALGITVRVRRDPAPAEQKVVLVNVFRAGTARERWKY